MKTIKTVFPILFLVIFSCLGYGQSDSLVYEDIVKLNNGLVLKGRITEVTEKGIRIDWMKGGVLFFNHSEIKLVNQGEHKDSLLPQHTYFDQNRKYLGQMTMGVSFGKRGQGLFDTRDFEGQFKMRISPTGGGQYVRFNLGRMGIDSRQSFSLWHIGTGYEAVFQHKKVSPFAYGNAGYGFGLKLNDNYDEGINTPRTVTTKGGFNYEVGAGLLFRSVHGYAFTVGTSFLYQPALIDIVYNTQWGGRNTFDLQLRRSLLKFGFVF